jgi:hypothetical protein
MATDVSVIFVGDNGWTDMTTDLPEERTTSAYGFHKPWWRGVTLYHRNGNKYEIERAIPDRRVPSPFLAATFYNPSFTARYEYRLVGVYKIDELKRAVHDAISNDPDVLTQFHGAGVLQDHIARAASFDDVVEVLRYAATEDDE